MRNFIHGVFALGVLLGTAGILNAEGTDAAPAPELVLTVDQAVELALAENLNLRQKGLSLRSKKRNKDNAWNRFLPQMGVSATFNASSQLFTDMDSSATVKNLEDPGALNFQAGFNLSLPLNFAALSGIKGVAADYEAELLDYESVRKQLERDVRKQFFFILVTQENIALTRQNLTLAEKRYEQARINYENGLISKLERLRAEVTVESLKPAYRAALAQYDSLVLLFKFLLGLDASRNIVFDGSLEAAFYDFDAETLIDTYTTGRLDIRSLEKQIQTLRHTRKTQALQANTPTMEFRYTYGIRATNNNSRATGNPAMPMESVDPWSNWIDNSTFSLGLQWRFDGLIPGSSVNVALKNLRDSIESLEIARRMLVENAGREITDLVNKLATNRQIIEANLSGVQLARESYELTEEAYRIGARELLDVEAAQTDLLKVSQQLLAARYEYIAALLDLEYSLNAPLSEFLVLRK